MGVIEAEPTTFSRDRGRDATEVRDELVSHEPGLTDAFRESIRFSHTSEIAESKRSIPIHRAHDARFAEHVEGFDVALKRKAKQHFESISTPSSPSSSTKAHVRC